MRLEKCKCGNLAVVYSLSRKEWMCKVCEAVVRNSGKKRVPGFILMGKGWPGKDLKDGKN